MFECNDCKNKKSEIESLNFRIKHLEEMNDKLTDRFMTLVNSKAEAVSLPEGYNKSDYYGDGDEVVSYHPIYGNKILTTNAALKK